MQQSVVSYMLLDGSLSYRITNESLQAIVEGMEISESDNVLAVGGSGDQILAIAEKARSVTVTDISSAQIGLIRMRMAHIKAGNIGIIHDFDQSYEDPTDLSRRNKYLEESRLERIRNKIDNVHVLNPMDIRQAAQIHPKGTFNKVYLSNILNWITSKWIICRKGVAEDSQNPSRTTLSELADVLPQDGIIYSASYVYAYPNDKLAVHVGLTERAREIETLTGRLGWEPTVYEKLYNF